MDLNWLKDVVVGNPDHPSIAHTVFLLAIVIAAGIFMSRIKLKGISFGMTWILFAGIALGHFGLKCDPEVLHFIKEFGLILFVFSIGLQVGPGFFSSLKSIAKLCLGHWGHMGKKGQWLQDCVELPIWVMSEKTAIVRGNSIH